MYARFCALPRARVHVCPNVGWIRDFADPQTVLNLAFNGDYIFPENNPNWPQLDDPAINRAMARARAGGRRAGAREAWAEIDSMITATAAGDPVAVGQTAERLLRGRALRAAAVEPGPLRLLVHVAGVGRPQGRAAGVESGGPWPPTSSAACCGASCSWLLVSALTFVVFYVLPSADPAQLRAGRSASPETLAQIRESLGLDEPLPAQYWTFLTQPRAARRPRLQLLQQRVGRLAARRPPAGDDLADARRGRRVGARRGAARRRLGACAAARGSTSSRPAARCWGSRCRSTGSGSSRSTCSPTTSGCGRCCPAPAATCRSPTDPWRWLDLADPAVARARLDLRRRLRAPAARQHDRGAVGGLRAHGAREGPERAARRAGATRCARAATPLVTLAGLDVGLLLGGAVLTETVFGIPGIGRLSYDAIVNADYPVIQGTVLLAALLRDRREHRRRRALRVPRPAGADGSERASAAASARRGPARRVRHARRASCRRSTASRSRSRPAARSGSSASPARGKTVAATDRDGADARRRARASSGRVLLDGEDLLERAARAAARAARRRDRDGLPGPAVARCTRCCASARRSRRRCARTATCRARPRARARSSCSSWSRSPDARRRARRLSARAVGRHAPARDDRDGARERAARADRRRADDRARRDRAGADPRAAASACATSWGWRWC